MTAVLAPHVAPHLAPHLAPGAVALFRDCVRATPGQRVLLVEEPDDAGYYDAAAPRLAAQAARALGLRVFETQAPPGADDATLADFVAALGGFDHVVFFARVGDQLRFAPAAGGPPATMCYTLDGAMLESAFGAACHCGMCALKAAVDDALAAAERVHVTCPRGTDYAGRIAPGQPPADTTVNRFPMLVHRPVPSDGFRGRVALSRFLVGCGAHFYEPYWRPLAADVLAHVEGARIVDFEGPAETVAAIRAHYLDVAGRYGVDPWCVHSWHAGIHPGCAFPRAATEDMLRWSGAAFGNPRLLHFHTCGAYAPGEISWNVVDATVTLDGVALWEAGRLHPERLPGWPQWRGEHPNLAALFDAPAREIGIATP